MGAATLAGLALLGIFGAIVSAVSGSRALVVQFASYWYYIIGLAAGFGVQVGLFVRLRQLIKNKTAAGAALGVTGTTSTAAMVSCCAHYAANVMPFLGLSGAFALLAQYQVPFFWFGLIANLAGIIFITRKIKRIKVE